MRRTSTLSTRRSRAGRIGPAGIWIAILLGVTACEDVITYRLDTTAPRLVIEGTVTDSSATQIVRISRTIDYFSGGTCPAVSAAEVTLTDDGGRSVSLSESAPGIYTTDTFPGLADRTYLLTVVCEGRTYTASSFMPRALEIDSLSVDEDHFLHIHFQDPPGIENQGRVRIFFDGEPIPDIIIFDDTLTDGNTVDFQYWIDTDTYDSAGTLRVQLLSIDRALFDYFDTLYNAMPTEEPDVFRPTPANPNTNLSGGALGYFGAFTVRTATIPVDFPH
jgi:hypothetical protein